MRQSMGWIGLAAVAVISCLSTGCQNKLYDENRALYRQNNELQAKLRENEARSSQMQAQPQSPDQSAQLASMQQEIANRDARITELQNQLNKPQPNTSSEDNNLLKGIEVTRDERAGTLTVNLPGDVLFASGSAELKQSAKATLDKVISAIRRDYANKKVLVRGYTDTDPITRTKDKWTDNLDLSAARSRTVAKYLTEQGLDSKRVGMQAYGETMPKNNKEHSRRVEIVVETR